MVARIASIIMTRNQEPMVVFSWRIIVFFKLSPIERQQAYLIWEFCLLLFFGALSRSGELIGLLLNNSLVINYILSCPGPKLDSDSIMIENTIIC